MKKYGIDIQMHPLHMHRRNAAERLTRTYKTTSYLDSLRQIQIHQSTDGTGYSLNAE